MELNITNLSKICRICLETKNELINLFMNKINNLSLADMLHECIQLKIDKNVQKSLPSVVCKNCAQQIKQFYNFKQMCFNSNKKLFQIVEKHKNDVCIVNDKNKLNCDECGKTFCNKSNLKRHKLIHSNKRLFQCTDCNLSFIQNVQLQDHTRRHHTFEKPFSCTKCDKKYYLQQDLKIHLNTHTLETKDIILNDTFTCGICNENFNTESNLKTHKLSHVNNHLCKDCGKSFTTKRGLKTHQELHNDKIISCEYCEKKIH